METRVLSIRVPEELVAQMDADPEGRSRSELVRVALGEHYGIYVELETTSGRRITEAQETEILDRAEAGQSSAGIAEDLGIGPETVRQIVADAGLSRHAGAPPLCGDAPGVEHPREELVRLPYATICKRCGKRVR